MRLKDEYLKKVKGNRPLRLELCKAHNNLAESTILRWLRKNDTMLAHKISARIISQFLSVSEDDLYIMEESDFNPVV